MTPRAADAQAAVLRRKSDEELVTLTRKGSSAAFEALFRRYSPPLVRYSERMLGASGAQAEDVVQEVMVAARGAIDTDQGPVNVGPWLYRATRNRCLNYMRDEAAAKRPPTTRNGYVEGQEFLEKIALRVPSASDQAERRAELRELVDDLHSLPESQRTALVLRELEGHGYEEVADSMGTTVPSVKSLLVRARLTLAEIAEARELQCEDVQLALARAEQKLGGLRPAERAHVRNCDECSEARKRMRATTKSLAALSPLGLSLSIKGALASALNGSGGAVATAGGAATAGAAGAAGLGGAGATAGGLLAGGVLAKSVIATVAVGLVAAGSVVVPNRDGGDARPASTPAPEPVLVVPPSNSGNSGSTSSGSEKLDPKAGSNGSDAVSIVAPSAADAPGAGDAVLIQEAAPQEEPEPAPETRTRTVPEDNSEGTRGRRAPGDPVVTTPPAVPESQSSTKEPPAAEDASDAPAADTKSPETTSAEPPAQP